MDVIFAMGALIGIGGLTGIGVLIKKHPRGSIYQKRALIGRRALNRIISVNGLNGYW